MPLIIEKMDFNSASSGALEMFKPRSSSLDSVSSYCSMSNSRSFLELFELLIAL